MATTLFLVRHGMHELVGSALAGRMAGVHLDEEGRAQAEALAQHLARERIAGVQTSPLERCRETAEPIAARLGLRAEAAEALTEIDCGAWTGKRFAALAADADWQAWNAGRGVAVVPGGESMIAAQARGVAHVDALRRRWPDQALVLVSHADVLRAIILAWLGLPLDRHDRIEIAPGSVSTLAVWQGGGKLLALNEVPAR